MGRQQVTSIFSNFNNSIFILGLLIILMLFRQSQGLTNLEEEAKRSSHNIMRFGRTNGHNIMRFGRAAGHNIMHFGKRYSDNMSNNDEGEGSVADYYQLPALVVSQPRDLELGRTYLGYPRILSNRLYNKKGGKDNVFMHFG